MALVVSATQKKGVLNSNRLKAAQVGEISSVCDGKQAHLAFDLKQEGESGLTPL